MSYKRLAVVSTSLLIILIGTKKFILYRPTDLRTENQSRLSNKSTVVDYSEIYQPVNQSSYHKRHGQFMKTQSGLETSYYACNDGKESSARSSERSTQKTNHIMFLKVHKAGSTTMENMFFRFGMRYNLTFVLPKRGVYVLAGGESDDILLISEGAHYDILACHTVYNPTKIARVLPANSVKIGIIREPFDRMVSAAYYYRDVMKSQYLLDVPKENFILNLIRKQSLYEKNEFSKTKNSMASDFGFPRGYIENMTSLISNYISKLVSEFSLILVMERFEESLILMKRYLNWDMFDILYIAANSHKHEQISLNSNDLAKFRSMCFLDYAIYEKFLNILESKITLEGKEFKEEVEHFKSVLNELKNFCDTSTKGDVLKINRSKWNCPFIVTSTDCRVMKMDVKYISLTILRKRHIKMHGLKDFT